MGVHEPQKSREHRGHHVSDEHDAASGEPSEAPTTPAPSGAPGGEAAESPTQPQATPAAADEPVTAAPVDEPVTVADPPAEAPTQVAPPAAASAGAAAAAPAAPPATAESSGAKGRGVFIPAWVAVVVGVLLIAGLGFAIGWIAAPNDDSNAAPAVATTPSQNGNGNGNSSNGNGNGNSQNVPSNPGNGNGNSSDDSSGDSSGDSTTPPLLRGAYLGVSVESAANNGGATITSVAADSPAASAGLKEGDVVTAVDGTQVTSALDLVRQIRAHDVNDSITVTYTRNGNSSDAKVTLESRPTTQSVS
ncbi:MAG TPA: PDZ domain-containing protein [Acidimicrobiia bacterium]|nr:PDZ domain-containing protein [Acidimicrobiia bacterium]